MIHGLWGWVENRRHFSQRLDGRLKHDLEMRTLFLFLVLIMAGWAEEENSARRLENAQTGMAEGSWPRKPDNRLSPLSGKMKNITVTSPRSYGREKEFRTRSWDDAEKVAGRNSAEWQAPLGRRWEEVHWNQAGEWEERERRNERFQPLAAAGTGQVLSYRDLDRESAPDWSSRSSSLAGSGNGLLRMYEGRLTRVREQVTREEKGARDLGPGRQEKFSPQEVERMLSHPVGELQGTVTEQSAGASPLSTAGN